MGGVSNKTTSHITWVLDLTYFSRLQRSKFKKNYEVGIFCYCSNVLTLCEYVSGHPLHLHDSKTIKSTRQSLFNFQENLNEGK
jgi:hypothetical protein